MRWIALIACFWIAGLAAAQETVRDSAVVELDGHTLFRVYGADVRPAVKRAEDIKGRIVGLAEDESFKPETLHVQERGELVNIVGNHVLVMSISEVDANMQEINRTLLAAAYVESIQKAIVDYRNARKPEKLANGAIHSILAILVAIMLVAMVRWILKQAEFKIQDALEQRTGSLTAASRQLLNAGRLWQALHGIFSLVRVVLSLIVALFLLEYILTQFPWTRGAGLHLLASVARPLTRLTDGFVAAMPNFFFLTILYFATRYGLSLARLYFDAIKYGRIQLDSFYPEWAQPTYNLVRITVIALALVIAYPLIPGSDSLAFKGLSILAGVMLSLASTTAVANVVAGYMLVFRRAFHVGDRVQIGAVEGHVTEMRMQVTHIRTPKNEEITIPNSMILSSEVKNYSNPAREGKLIVHSEVGIGYEVPWRQVEAMLIEAARRTHDVLHEPAPFVLQLKLGDFAVVYQINAYTQNSDTLPLVYADLHRNIIDEFNEHGVQIMTPAYEGDPEQPKVVRKDRWFEAPARPEQVLM